MGRATIQTHLGEGRYRILYHVDNSAAAARIAELEALKTALDAQLSGELGLLAGRDIAQAVYDEETQHFQAALDAWAACSSLLPPCKDAAAYLAAARAAGTKRAAAARALSGMNAAILGNRADYLAATQEIAYLASTSGTASAGTQMDAWCIDYDPGALIPPGTVVGTIETYGARAGQYGIRHPAKYVNIQASGAAAYNATRDHCVKPYSSIPPATLFFMTAQWLHVMAANPLHAIGTIAAIDYAANTADVLLAGETPITAAPTGYPFVSAGGDLLLEDVQIEYLDCDADAFAVEDVVVVRFGAVNRGSPIVIGFAYAPKKCSACLNPYIWPWHGEVYGGLIHMPGGNTHAMSQPAHGYSWLIDREIDDLELTPEAEAAGLLWLNYSMIAGGIYYGEDIGNNSFIYMDNDGRCWKIAIEFSYPVSNTIRIKARIRRYSIYEYYATEIEKTIDVECSSLSTFGGLNAAVDDVWTNGGRALIGVEAYAYDVYSNPVTFHLVSIIEITLNGIGGDDGSGIDIAGIEINTIDELYENSSTIMDLSRCSHYDKYGGASYYKLRYMDIPDVPAYTTCDWLYGFELYDGASLIDGLYFDHCIINGGSLSEIPWHGSHLANPSIEIINSWASSNRYSSFGMNPDAYSTDWKFGVARFDHGAAAFFGYHVPTGGVTYGTAATQTGPESVGLSTSSVFRAWNRKTGATIFRSTPVVFV